MWMFTLFLVTVSLIFLHPTISAGVNIAGENPQHDPHVLTAYILEKLHSCMFFDDEIVTSMFFPTLHDAMLHVLEQQKEDKSPGQVVRKTSYTVYHSFCSGLLYGCLVFLTRQIYMKHFYWPVEATQHKSEGILTTIYFLAVI